MKGDKFPEIKGNERYRDVNPKDQFDRGQQLA